MEGIAWCPEESASAEGLGGMPGKANATSSTKNARGGELEEEQPKCDPTSLYFSFAREREAD